MSDKQSDQQQKVDLYSFPRRIDLASVLTISFAYALFFAFLKSLGSSPELSAILGGLFAVVALAQATLFSGKRPRLASLIVGGVYWLITMGALVAFHSNRTADVCTVLSATLLWGPPLGYFAGTLVGGVFLVADKIRKGIASIQS